MDKAIIFAILGLLILGLLFANPISNFFKGIFGGKQAPPKATEIQKPPIIGTPKEAIEKIYEEPIKQSIEIRAEPDTFLAGEQTTAITVENHSTSTLEKAFVFIYNEDESVKVFLEKNFSLSPQMPETFEWDGTSEDDARLPEGQYFAAIASPTDQQVINILPIKVLQQKQFRNRQTLIDANPWPNQIETTLTPQKPAITMEEYDGKELFAVNPYPDNNPLIDDFPRPTPNQIYIKDTSQAEHSLDFLKKIAITVVDEEQDSTEWGEKPFKMKISLNYSDFFKQKPVLPQVEEFDIQIKTPTYPDSPKIRLKVILNETGAILYKKGSPQDEETMKKIAAKKGWALIPIEQKAGLASETPTLIVIGTTPQNQAQTTSQKEIREKIIKEYKKQPFKYLLIIGAPQEIPMADSKGTPLDSSYYANTNDDAFAELFVGRLPMSAQQAKDYFDRLEEAKGYGFFLGTQKVFERGYKNASDEENNRAIVREIFQSTGIKPVFPETTAQADPALFPQNLVHVATETRQLQGKEIIDYFAANCPQFEQLAGQQKVSLIINARYCPMEAGEGTPSFAQSNAANVIAFTKKLQKENGQEFSGDELVKKLNEAHGLENYFLAIQGLKVDATTNPTKKSIGESFTDYLNGSILFAGEKKPYGYILFGDPSNLLDYQELPEPNIAYRAFTEIGTKENKIALTMPEINLNELLARDTGFFSEKDIKSIQEGKFVDVDATILEEEFPFATKLDYFSPDLSNIKYSLELTDGKTSTILDEIQIELPQDKKSATINEINPFNFNKIVLKASTMNKTHVAEILRAPTKWPKEQKIAPQSELPKGLSGNYYHDRIVLKHASGTHSNFLDAKGEITGLTNSGGKASFKVSFKGLPATVESGLRYKYYLIVLESPNGEKQLLKSFSLPSGGQTYSYEIQGSLDIGTKKFDSIKLYGSQTGKLPVETATASAQGLFETTPILQGELKDGHLKNTAGFLQYPNGTATVDLYYSASTSSKPNLVYTVEYDAKPFIKGGTDKTIIFAASNPAMSKYATPSVAQAIQKIKNSGTPMGAKIRQLEENNKMLVALNARTFLALYIQFAQNKHYLSNSFALMPAKYTEGATAQKIKEALDATKDFETTAQVFTSQNIPFKDSFKIEEGNNRAISFEFGLKNLFELIKNHAADYKFTIKTNTLEAQISQSIPKEPEPAQPEEPAATQGRKQQETKATIKKVFVGAVEINTAETFDLSDKQRKTLAVYATTNAEQFDSIQLFLSTTAKTQLIGSLDFSELEKTYLPGKEILVSSSKALSGYLSPQDTFIRIFVDVENPKPTAQAQNIQSTPIRIEIKQPQ
ncbi:MAG: C25 family cysteine peptidase [archaeon]